MTMRLPILLLIVCHGMATAQTVADSLAQSRDMGEVVVTATRTRRLLKDVPVLTRVIGRADIERADATDLRDLLQQELAGVEFTYSMNQRLNMNMGGFSGQSVLVLVDGERLAGETMENVDFSRIDMANVERIEIVRGAQSALYGAGAVGGVINVITRDASSPWSLRLDARLADHREQRYGGLLGTAQGRVGNTLEVRHTRQDNYVVCMDYADACEFRNVYGGRTLNVRDRLVFRPTEHLRLTARASYFFREQHADADTYERARDFSGGLRADWDISVRDRLEASVSYDQYDKSDLLRLWRRDIMDYRNLQVSTRALYNRTLRLRDMLTMGAEHMRDLLISSQFGNGQQPLISNQLGNGQQPRLQHTAALFAQYDCFLSPRFEAVGAARWDWFSDAGGTSSLTAKAALRYTLSPRASLRASYAGGFRAPTLKEKYSRFNMVGDIYVMGNEALRPERSHNFNLSAECTWRTCTFSLAASYSRVSDRISTSAPQRGGNDGVGEYTIRYINTPLVRVFGLELLARGRWRLNAKHALSARAAYVFTREWTAPDAHLSPYCPARPHSMNLRLDLDSRWTRSCATTLSVQGRVLSSISYDTMLLSPPYALRTVHNPAYTLWKVQFSTHLGKALTLNLALDNIFNYAPRTYYFNSPVTLGANLMCGITLDVDKLF